MKPSELTNKIHQFPAEALHELSAIFSDADDLAKGLHRAKIDIAELEDAVRAFSDEQAGDAVELKNERLEQNDLDNHLSLFLGQKDLSRKAHFTAGACARIAGCIEAAKGILGQLLMDSVRKKESKRIIDHVERLLKKSEGKKRNALPEVSHTQRYDHAKFAVNMANIGKKNGWRITIPACCKISIPAEFADGVDIPCFWEGQELVGDVVVSYAFGKNWNREYKKAQILAIYA